LVDNNEKLFVKIYSYFFGKRILELEKFVILLDTKTLKILCVATPLWDKCEGESHTPKSGNLESSETPKNSELDFRGENTSH
jgi:hypothetical protein